jgi:TatD DNase family protein
MVKFTQIYFDAHAHYTVTDASALHISMLEQSDCPQAAYGIHPMDASSDFSWEKLTNLWSETNCVAVGEIGLDKRYPDLKTQAAVLERQLASAIELQLPVILHCVKAWNELSVVLKRYDSPLPYVVHGVRKRQLLQEIHSFGAIVGVGTYALKDAAFLAALEVFPPNRILLESDAFSPVDLEPLYACVAKRYSLTLHEFLEIQRETLQNTFPKWHIG